MSQEQPPRLRDGELGPILRAEQADISPQRLADNGERVKALIAAGSTTIAWKLLGILLLVGAVTTVIVLYLRPDHAPLPQPDAAPIVAVAADVASPADAAEPADADEPDAATAMELPDAARATRPRIGAAQPPDAGVDPVAADAPVSDLPAQIALYNAARSAAAARDFATALAKLDELLRQYPATPLRADAELARADALARAGRLADAAAAFSALARDDAHRGRRGELLRTLGDLYRQLGDCAKATDAYTRALAERLGERDRTDAQRGRDRCTQR